MAVVSHVAPLALAQHQATLAWIPLDAIVATIQSRQLREPGITRLVESMERGGFLPQYPLAVSTLDVGYRLLAGHHRVEAAKRLAMETVPALLYSDLTPDEEWRVAVETNRAHEAATLPTFVDDAELVWKLVETGRKQEDVAGIMGWSREKVAQYNQLAKIDTEAWRVVVTSFQNLGNNQNGDEVTELVTQVTSIFGEKILREIVQLTPTQQLELVRLLVKDPKAKSNYRKQAERYKARNALEEEAKRALRHVPVELLDRALAEIAKGVYDAEWQAQKLPGERFRKLIQQVLDDHAKKQNYQLYLGRFEDIAYTLPPDSVDVIILDPPYGHEALPLYPLLATAAAHLLKPGGRLFVLMGQLYGYEAQTAFRQTLTFCWEVAYTTPGGQSVQIWTQEVNTFWKPIYWFEKPPHKETRWAGDVLKSAPNDNDKRFHKWGQSESGMADVIAHFTEPGDLICDLCMGAGTTGVAAIKAGRKFIGIEMDEEHFLAAEQRLQGAV